jgi:hypothetical protein
VADGIAVSEGGEYLVDGGPARRRHQAPPVRGVPSPGRDRC